MLDYVAKWMNELGSKDRTARGNAVVALAYFLDGSSLEHYLSPDELTAFPAIIPASELCQFVLHGVCMNIIRSEFKAADLFWIIGKAPPNIAIKFISMLIQGHENDITGESAYQLLISLENCLTYQDERSLSEVVNYLRFPHFSTFIRQCTHSDYEKLAEIARRLIESLAKYTV